MIVRDLNEAKNTERHVHSEGWDSVRLLLKSDEMGFSFHITTIHAGADLTMHYKNHLECVYCVDGTGSIKDLATGETHQIKPGVMYALDKHDKHILRADAAKPMIMACVFNPPVTGNEVHQADGSYALEDA
ncbi:ectoine synthase [Nitratireductor aquimarinus]|uniref:ectoine synthase n=1 Tax=Nitratireductor aquimarinus TaxID=889300 RepID=UPI001A8F230D|nr:ectoine synthase [Nitratireductor aquimarinus]MBN8244416.1 ectoine synthase [Nitratireductor aquimarinus]MBY6132806.1 ectoine synthase [Nitratireductor aquimarinus]MCA1304390.1 ectoine synthase [Nitratireductor aquimarinus]